MLPFYGSIPIQLSFMAFLGVSGGKKAIFKQSALRTLRQGCSNVIEIEGLANSAYSKAITARPQVWQPCAPEHSPLPSNGEPGWKIRAK